MPARVALHDGRLEGRGRAAGVGAGPEPRRLRHGAEGEGAALENGARVRGAAVENGNGTRVQLALRTAASNETSVKYNYD